VIRWITENLGTASWEETRDQTDFVVVDVRDMVDKAGNTTELVTQKIREALYHIDAGHKVVIACDYGISRSNSVAVGVLAKAFELSFSEAARRVMTITGEKALRVEVLARVREALGVENNPQDAGSAGDRRKILVTGGQGFIATATIPVLAQLHEVYAPSRLELNLLSDTVAMDLLVKEEGVDCVVHLANPRVYTNNAALGDSLTMLRNVLDVCEQNCVRLIYPSGWEVYSGYRSQRLLACEALPRWPRGPYGETKLLCETLIEHHHRAYGLRYSIVRSSPVYGGGDRPKFIYNFIGKALAGQEIRTHRYLNGFPTLDLLHVSDFVSAMKAIIESERVGSVNVGSGRAVSTTEVAQMIVSLSGSASVISHQDINDFAPNIEMDHNFATSTLGWQPAKPLADGLAEMVQAERERWEESR
jgi:nucleoside-diphosphate-sugar epimerase